MNPEKGIVFISGCNSHTGSAVMQRLAGRFSGIVGLNRDAPMRCPLPRRRRGTPGL